MASPDPLATMREQLAAAQADNRALREALDALEYTDEDAEGLATCVAWPKPSWVRDLLSRAPGSDDALREMLTWAASEGARAGEEGARLGHSETNEAIVSRVLGGKEEAR